MWVHWPPGCMWDHRWWKGWGYWAVASPDFRVLHKILISAIENPATVQHKILAGQNFGGFDGQLTIHQSFIRQILCCTVYGILQCSQFESVLSHWLHCKTYTFKLAALQNRIFYASPLFCISRNSQH